MNYRVIGTNGREYGPVSAEQLRAWIREGRVQAGTLVRTEASQDWRPLSGLPEFAAFLGATPPRASSYNAPSGVRQTNPWAVWSLVCGILSLTCCSCCCVPFHLLGIVFGIIGLVQISNHPETQTGTSIAIIGLVLCVLSLIMGLLLSASCIASDGQGFYREFGHQLNSGAGLIGQLLM